MIELDEQQQAARDWFESLRDRICDAFEEIVSADDLVELVPVGEHLPDAPWRGLVTALGYPVGFLMVVLARQQLFTENTITVVLPVMAEPSPAR